MLILSSLSLEIVEVEPSENGARTRIFVFAGELSAEGVRDAEGAVTMAKRLLDAGAYMIMLESEGVTENVKTWRTEVPAKMANALG